MLYYNFNNYEGFKERFGIITHGNGVKSRNNKILLAWYKQPALLRKARETGDYSDLNVPSMASLWNVLSEKVSFKSNNTFGRDFSFFTLNNIMLASKSFYLDELQGVCEDGDIRSIRYVNKENGRAFKMKAGRFFNKCLEDLGIEWPEPVRLWMCEEFSRQWETYASSSQVSKTGTLELHVDDDFESIYSSDECDGDFGSCMVDDGQWTFYRDAVNAQAAYLRSTKTGEIVARCIVFNEVHDDGTGEVVRLAERQYSTDGDEVLKRLLVDALIKGKYIDGYKKVGVSCHDNRAYVSNSGEDWSHRHFSIECNLDDEDTLSYQDSFVYYDMNERRAYNYDNGEAVECLNDTNEYFNAPVYDSWNKRYTNEELYEVWSGGTMYETDYYTREEHFTRINGCYYDNDEVSECERCGSHFLYDEGVYSDLLDRYFCCQSCCDEAEEDYRRSQMTYSDYDEEYFEDADDVTEWKRYIYSRVCQDGYYFEQTISIGSLAKLIDKGEVIYCNGMYYELPFIRMWDALHHEWRKIYND